MKIQLTLEQLTALQNQLPLPKRRGEFRKAFLQRVEPPSVKALATSEFDPIEPAGLDVLCEAVVFDTPDLGPHLRWVVHCQEVVLPPPT